MHRSICRVVVALLTTVSVWGQSSGTLLGFSATSSPSQTALENRFDASLKAENLRDWLKRLSARPHHLGSAYNKENADFIAAQFKSWGYETTLEEFHVLFPTPKTRIVEMTAPEKYTMKLQEPEFKEDATSGQV